MLSIINHEGNANQNLREVQLLPHRMLAIQRMDNNKCWWTCGETGIFIHCECVLSHVWLFMTPGTVAHQASLSLELSQQEYWSEMSFLPSGRSPGGGHGNPLLYSCLENPMDREAWQATVHRVTQSQTWLEFNHKITGLSPFSAYYHHANRALG